MSMRVRSEFGPLAEFGKPFDLRDRVHAVDLSGVDDLESPRFARTQQQFKEQCDVNEIMKRFERTGMLDHLNTFQGNYGDFLDVPQSFHDAVNQVLSAQDMFMTIPARVRAEFNNDPGEFLAFVSDPANADRMVELGLATRPVVVEEPDVASREAPSIAASPE